MMTRDEFIAEAARLKRLGMSIDEIHKATAGLGFLTRYGRPPARATIAFWLSTYTEGLPDLRKRRTRKPESHYRQKRAEANRRYYAKNKERLRAYRKNYYDTYVKGAACED